MNPSLVRSIIAVIFALAVAIGLFVGKTPPEAFFALAGGAITHFFNGGLIDKSIKTANEATATAASALAASINAKKAS